MGGCANVATFELTPGHVGFDLPTDCHGGHGGLGRDEMRVPMYFAGPGLPGSIADRLRCSTGRRPPLR